ncbi:hypothetical protein PM082_018165 [Marasmius tenuissimus]|nr:hypothetical protein PM082_018165 [Marasmius tenuissimus]
MLMISQSQCLQTNYNDCRPFTVGNLVLHDLAGGKLHYTLLQERIPIICAAMLLHILSKDANSSNLLPSIHQASPAPSASMSDDPTDTGTVNDLDNSSMIFHQPNKEVSCTEDGYTMSSDVISAPNQLGIVDLNQDAQPFDHNIVSHNESTTDVNMLSPSPDGTTLSSPSLDPGSVMTPYNNRVSDSNFGTGYEAYHDANWSPVLDIFDSQSLAPPLNTFQSANVNNVSNGVSPDPDLASICSLDQTVLPTSKSMDSAMDLADKLNLQFSLFINNVNPKLLSAPNMQNTMNTVGNDGVPLSHHATVSQTDKQTTSPPIPEELGVPTLRRSTRERKPVVPYNSESPVDLVPAKSDTKVKKTAVKQISNTRSLSSEPSARKTSIYQRNFLATLERKPLKTRLERPRISGKVYYMLSYGGELYIYQPFMTRNEDLLLLDALVNASGSLCTVPDRYAKYFTTDLFLSEPSTRDIAELGPPREFQRWCIKTLTYTSYQEKSECELQQIFRTI